MKKLSELCKRLKITDTSVYEDIPISGVQVNSALVTAGDLFFVTCGNEKYVADALSRGAAALIAEKIVEGAPCVAVCDIRKSIALVCADFYDNPENSLKIVSVVGTNGKTSITHILSGLFSPYKKTAVLGTIGFYIDGKLRIDTGMTSPDPPVLFKALRMAADEGAEYVFCEITAHAIFFDKFYGIRSELCIFTNITQDHLDFFGSMEKYAAAKLGYFINGNVKIGIINADDKYGREIINSGKLCCVSYGIEQPSDVFAIEISHDKGLSFVANAFDDIMYIKTCLLGRINVYNLLAAVAAARLAGISPEKIENAARGLAPVEGRMNVIGYEPKVIVDFAHTPDGVLQALTAVRETVNGRIIAVFGCGGNRDKLKRPIMAGIGVKYADVCVFTSDNPRDENPEDIIGDMIKGVGDSGNYIVIQDRINAIEFAVKLAGKDDCVLVCGKGGENYTEIKGARVPYSDKAVCAAALEKKKCRK